jgi:hypothetical protein
MTWDYAERRRREHNYRLMFKVALAFLVLGILLTSAGAIVWASEANSFIFGIGLVFTAVAGMSAYLSVRSTTKIIDLDASEGRRSKRRPLHGDDR